MDTDGILCRTCGEVMCSCDELSAKYAEIKRLEGELHNIRARNIRMNAMLRKAAAQFDHYRELHIGKGSHEKAVVNGRYAAECRAAIDKDGPNELDRLEGVVSELDNALLLALPYVETAEHDEIYKPGAVRKIVTVMRKAIAKAGV